MQVNIQLILSLLAVAPLLVEGGKAPRVKKNPKNVVAIADFPMGNVVFSAKQGTEVNVHVDVTGLPPTGGPFYYHIHENGVNGNGNCDNVGENFNPYGGTLGTCDIETDDSYCQVGDLSGKHGWLNTTCFETKYVDPYLSLNKLSKSYIVGRSISFHYANDVKFACADIQIATSAMLETLVNEYKYDDIESIKILQVSVADDFNAVEALQLESYTEEDPTSRESKRATSSKLVTDDAVDEDSDDEGDEQKHLSGKKNYYFDYGNQSNLTNKSNATHQQYQSIHSENGSSLKNFGLGVGLAGLISMLI